MVKSTPLKPSIRKITSALHKKRQTYSQRFRKKFPDAHKLFEQKQLQPHQLRQHATRLLTGATVATSLLAQPAAIPSLPVDVVSHHLNQYASQHHLSVIQAFADQLQTILPADRGQLNPWEIGQVNLIMTQTLGVTGTAELDGHRLLHQYGLIGTEQHLKRYPGDSLGKHDELQSAGVAPGKGAWGYFAPSASELTETDIQREKYYVAVQTLYLPEWRDNQPDVKEWYKYRKMVVINPENGQAVVAVIADAGPAKWTGKVFGGSPEVMQQLGLHEGSRKGKVIMLFLNDPEDKVPLGPLGYRV